MKRALPREVAPAQLVTWLDLTLQASDAALSSAQADAHRGRTAAERRAMGAAFDGDDSDGGGAGWRPSATFTADQVRQAHLR